MNPPVRVLAVLAIAGLVHASRTRRQALADLLQAHRGLFFATSGLAIAVAVAHTLAALRGWKQSDLLPVASCVLLCLPTLALLLRDAAFRRATLLLLGLLCAWHFAMLPVEAVSGWKLSWHPSHPLPRPTWPLNYQASGLAWQTFTFVGLYLPLFYLAWGFIGAERQSQGRPLPAGWAWLPLAWLLPAACVQSRSGFAGAVMASALALVHGLPRARARMAVVACVAAAVVYGVFLAVDKSGMDLRAPFMHAYLAAALDPQWIWIGRGFSRASPALLEVPGLMTLAHSHNDLIQVLYSGGLPVLLAYLAFWGALLQLAWRHAAAGQPGPACALVAFLPTTVTDVGLHFYEKAVFLVLVAAFAAATAPVRLPCGSAAAGPARRWPRRSGVLPSP